MWWLIETDDSRTRAFQRLVLAFVMSAHGAQKLFGWFGGGGLDATVRGMSRMLPVPIVYLVILSETLGSVLLALGLLGRLAALGTTCVMLGAVAAVHLRNGLFMNWGGGVGGEGFEYHLLALALSLPIVMKGAGAWSFDRGFTLRHRAFVESHPLIAPPPTVPRPA